MNILKVVKLRIVSEHPSLESALEGLTPRSGGYYDADGNRVSFCIDGTAPDPEVWEGYTFGCFAAFSPQGAKRVGGTFSSCKAVPPEKVPGCNPGHRYPDLRVAIQIHCDDLPEVKAIKEKEHLRQMEERARMQEELEELEELLDQYSTKQLLAILRAQ